MTPVTCKIMVELHQNEERQRLHDVGATPTSPRSIFTNHLAQMKTAAAGDDYVVANSTSDNHVQFLDHLSDAEIDATTWSIANMGSIVNQLERQIDGIAVNNQILFTKEFSICLIISDDFCEAWAFRRCGKPLNSP